MRKVEYISPSGLGIFLTDREEFYIRYLAEAHPTRPPQTIQMAAGAAFDLEMKKFLGFQDAINGTWNPVEDHNREAAIPVGKELFDKYMATGFWANFLQDLGGLNGAKLEAEIKGTVKMNGKEVPLLGKPDFSISVDGIDVVLDWKVNGYYSTSSPSPKPGYTKATGGRANGGCHKDCVFGKINNLYYNRIDLNNYLPDWAPQLTTYGWLLGCGKPLFVVHQLLGKECRVAEYRGFVSGDYEKRLWDAYCECWDYCQVEQPQLEKKAKLYLESDFAELARVQPSYGQIII